MSSCEESPDTAVNVIVRSPVSHQASPIAEVTGPPAQQPVEPRDHGSPTSAQPALHCSFAECCALVMTQLNQTIDPLRQRHKSGWTGICDTCDLIWPCPPIRTMLIALGAIDDEDT